MCCTNTPLTPPPFVIICSSSGQQYPGNRYIRPEKPSASNWVAIEPERGWGANPPTLFNNSAPGSPLPLQTPVPAPGPRPAAHYMGSLAASTGKPQLLQGSTKPSRRPSNKKKRPLTNHLSYQPTYNLLTFKFEI